MKEIENIELTYLKTNDYQQLKDATIEAYSMLPESYWKEKQIKTLIDKFPEGQAVIKINNELAGCVHSIIIDCKKFENKHTYQQITENYTYNTHNSEGDILYGIDIFVKPEFCCLRLERRLYDYRKELCERLN